MVGRKNVLFLLVTLLALFSSSSTDLMVGRKNVLGQDNLLLDFFWKNSGRMNLLGEKYLLRRCSARKSIGQHVGLIRVRPYHIFLRLLVLLLHYHLLLLLHHHLVLLHHHHLLLRLLVVLLHYHHLLLLRHHHRQCSRRRLRFDRITPNHSTIMIRWRIRNVFPFFAVVVVVVFIVIVIVHVAVVVAAVVVAIVAPIIQGV